MKFSEFKPDPKVTEVSNETKTDIEEKIKSYEKLSQQELLEEFIKESQVQKANGNLNNDKIKTIKDTLSPLLSDDQKQNLDYLLGIIDNDK